MAGGELAGELAFLEREGLSHCLPLTVALVKRELGFQAPPEVAMTKLSEKIMVPLSKNPHYNFVGRILGPRGQSLKKIEAETDCRVLIRGAGSIRNKRNEDRLRRKRGNEHLNEPLHVIIETSQPSVAQATQALARAREIVEELLDPLPDEEDTGKKGQLRALRKLNGQREPPRSPAQEAGDGVGSPYQLQSPDGVRCAPTFQSPVLSTAQHTARGPFASPGRVPFLADAGMTAVAAPFVPTVSSAAVSSTAPHSYYESAEQLIEDAESHDEWRHLTSSWLGFSGSGISTGAVHTASPVRHEFMPYRRLSRSPEKF
jgi:KH-domain type I